MQVSFQPRPCSLRPKLAERREPLSYRLAPAAPGANRACRRSAHGTMHEPMEPAPRTKTRATPVAANRAARDSEAEQEKNLEGKPLPATRPCAADAN